MKIQKDTKIESQMEDKRYLMEMDITKPLTQLFKQLVSEQPSNPFEYMARFFEVPQKTFYFIEIDTKEKEAHQEQLVSLFERKREEISNSIGHFEVVEFEKEKTKEESLEKFFLRMKDSPIKDLQFVKKMVYEEEEAEEVLKTDEMRFNSKEEQSWEVQDDHQFLVPVFILGSLKSLQCVLTLIRSKLSVAQLIILKPNSLQSSRSDLSLIREKLPNKSHEIYFQEKAEDFESVFQKVLRVANHDTPLTSVRNVILFTKNRPRRISLVKSICDQLGLVNLGLLGVFNQAQRVGEFQTNLILNSGTRKEIDLKNSELDFGILEERLKRRDVRVFGSLLHGECLEDYSGQINWDHFDTVMVDFSCYSEEEIGELREHFGKKHVISLATEMELDQLIRNAIYNLTI